MKTTKQPIGLDANFREVFPGDEVRDADGTAYTIMANGWAKPLGGGNEVAFKRLKEPTVTLAAVVIPGPTPHTRKAVQPKTDAPGPVKSAPRTAPSPAPAAEPGPVQAEPRTAPRTPKCHGGGKKNNSGWSKLSAIVKRLGISGVGLTGYLRDNGFDVYRAEGTSCVKVEDREKVLDFLRQNPPPRDLPKTSSYDGTVRRIRKDVEAGEARKKLAALSSVPIPEGPAKVRTVHVDSLPGTCTVRDAADQILVDELLARGWTVTCVKHTEL